MKYKIITRPEAENDLKEAFLWYEDKRKGLGYEFLLHIDAGVRFIQRNPVIYKSTYKDTLKYLVKRFPYKIIYLIEKNTIFILAIIHTKRNPELIKKRLRNI